MFPHYVVVLIPQDCGWSEHFPDFPGCHAEGARIETAIGSAMRVVLDTLEDLNQRGNHMSSPKSYEEIRADSAWARERDIDWSGAVISLVRVGDVRGVRQAT